mmetsp:Transcript_140090/g.448026  ORF Transcript_140090/g.448026 Transcript_140090/m.448026 type:complete len:86 (-) Transcript_140090:26-283(-)
MTKSSRCLGLCFAKSLGAVLEGNRLEGNDVAVEILGLGQGESHPLALLEHTLFSSSITADVRLSASRVIGRAGAGVPLQQHLRSP